MIKARETSGTNPLKITCDNMIIVWDNVHGNPTPIIIWDDDNETLISIRPNTEEFQDVYPFEILLFNYEQIQYMESYMRPKDTMEWIEKEHSSRALTKEQYEEAIKMYSEAISKRSYTGTTNPRNFL